MGKKKKQSPKLGQLLENSYMKDLHSSLDYSTNTQKALDDCQHEATQKCASHGKYFTTGLLLAAWGFLFEEEHSNLRSVLIVIIILSIIYYAWDMWRSFCVASRARKLWNELGLGVYTAEQVSILFNQTSNWSFTILKFQLLLLVLNTLLFIGYCVVKLIQ